MIDEVIARVRAVYGGWGKGTTVAKMRADWDALFASDTELEPVPEIGAHWIGPPSDRAFLYFHGGGFRVGSARSHAELIARIAAASGARGLAVEYRLAPEHRFPAQLEDVRAAYEWALQRFAPSRLALVGDSAGGNLALALMLSRGALPMPAAAVLLSPWTDLAATGASYQTRAAADPIHQRGMILAIARGYLGDADPRDPRASPLYGDMTKLPPLLIQVGDRETVLDDSVRLAAKARAAGVMAELQVWDGMIHVFQQFPELPEAARAVAAVGAFLRERLGG
jgi:epsilon-lactone hydrolase